LERPFALIAFDWDGTAVTDRREDTTVLRHRLERLLAEGVVVAIISGTNFPNIDRQCTARIGSAGKENLFVCTNRGSEVYGWGADGRPRRLWLRVASPEEERRLTEVADAVQEMLVRRTGLEVAVIYDRMNRRKIDLIPLPEWRDPPKSMIGQLLAAVERRLRKAGVAGGIGEVFDLAHRTAEEHGLADARITSDVKHIEIGLTDKSDSVRYLMAEVAAPRGLQPEAVLIAGDEFGPIAGFPGSDSFLIVPEAAGASYVSVGLEPNGVPPGVLHLGGGPARFGELLERQIALHARRTSAPERGPAPPPLLPFHPTRDPRWTLVEEGFNLAREHEIESLFATSNGYVGTRGSLAEGSALSAPATFVAGIFARAPGEIPALVRAPDWMSLEGEVAGHPIRLDEGTALEHRRMLDLRQGILWREWRHRDPAGRITRLLGLRLTSLADRHLLVQMVALTPENYSGALVIRSRIQAARPPVDPATAEASVTSAAHPPAFPTTPAAQPHPLLESFAVPGTEERIAFASAATLAATAGGQITQEVVRSAGEVVEGWGIEVEMGARYRLARGVVVYTTRETADPEGAAARHLAALEGDLTDAVRAHIAAWGARWRDAAIELEGDDEAARVLHFAAYHLISAANPEDARTSVGARALTGESYLGHVFWDTEIFMLPFYTLTHPPSARALLMYRFHTLSGARENARRRGYRGALFAWESAASGEETTPTLALAPDGVVVRIRSGELEHHISADVAYAVWQYWTLSGDDRFFLEAGAEILLETARFWASRGELEGDGHYHIRHVIGPDEYHEDVDDNAYTNLMARWNLRCGAEAARILAERAPERWYDLTRKLALEADEPSAWERLAEAMYTGFDPETGIFEQFSGFFALEDVDPAAYEPRQAPLDVLLGRARVRGSKISKQGDVVLAILLLWDEFPPAVREANFRYYEPRCGHGSSLSPAIHAQLAARLGDLPLAGRYFRQGAEIDLANNMGNAAGGVHVGALGGLWQAAVLGYGGYRPNGERLVLEPHIPAGWERMRFRLHWRGRVVEVDSGAGGRAIVLRLVDGDPLPVVVAGHPEMMLDAGAPLRYGGEER
jgi:kojibiose phosphorylase